MRDGKSWAIPQILIGSHRRLSCSESLLSFPRCSHYHLLALPCFCATGTTDEIQLGGNGPGTADIIHIVSYVSPSADFRGLRKLGVLIMLVREVNFVLVTSYLKSVPKSYGPMPLSYDAVDRNLLWRAHHLQRTTRPRWFSTGCLLCSIRSSRLKTGFHGHSSITSCDELGLVKGRSRKSAIPMPFRREVGTVREVGRLAEPSWRLILLNRYLSVSTQCLPWNIPRVFLRSIMFGSYLLLA